MSENENKNMKENENENENALTANETENVLAVDSNKLREALNQWLDCSDIDTIEKADAMFEQAASGTNRMQMPIDRVLFLIRDRNLLPVGKTFSEYVPERYGIAKSTASIYAEIGSYMTEKADGYIFDYDRIVKVIDKDGNETQGIEHMSLSRNQVRVLIEYFNRDRAKIEKAVTEHRYFIFTSKDKELKKALAKWYPNEKPKKETKKTETAETSENTAEKPETAKSTDSTAKPEKTVKKGKDNVKESDSKAVYLSVKAWTDVIAILTEKGGDNALTIATAIRSQL